MSRCSSRESGLLSLQSSPSSEPSLPSAGFKSRTKILEQRFTSNRFDHIATEAGERKEMGNLGEDGIADAGAWDFLKRCAKLIWGHGRLFLWILALIVFPLLVVEYALAGVFTLVEMKSVVLPEIQKWAANNYTNVEVDPGAIASTVGIAVGGALIDQLISIIPIICVVYSVAAILSKNSVTFADAVGAVPRLWRPVILTSLSLFTVGIAELFILGLMNFAAFLSSSIALVLVTAFVITLLALFLVFAFQLAVVASVLEGVHGWKALGKSWRLIQGKKWVAFRTMGLGYFIILFAMHASNWICNRIFAILGISTDPLLGAASHAILASAIQVVVRALLTSVSTVLYLGIETFFYFSCKALHGESVTVSDFVQDGAYEQVGQHPEHSEV